MTVERVLLCVGGSPIALEATRLTIGLALGWGARVRAVFVVQDGVIVVPGSAGDGTGRGPGSLHT